jgi:hypothetical protein
MWEEGWDSYLDSECHPENYKVESSVASLAALLRETSYRLSLPWTFQLLLNVQGNETTNFDCSR